MLEETVASLAIQKSFKKCKLMNGLEINKIQGITWIEYACGFVLFFFVEKDDNEEVFLGIYLRYRV